MLNTGPEYSVPFCPLLSNLAHSSGYSSFAQAANSSLDQGSGKAL